MRSNTKARSAAVHYKQLLAVGPEERHGGPADRRKDTAKDHAKDVVDSESEGEQELLGIVLDYYISSADLLPQFESLEVLPKERFSDHCPVSLKWNGSVDELGTSSALGSSSVLGWSISRILEAPSEYEQLKQRSAYAMSRHPDLTTVKE